MTKLYHTDVFVPEELRQRARMMRFRQLLWSKHAQHELINDPHGAIDLAQVPHSFDALTGWELVELEASGPKIEKYVFRKPIDIVRSLVLVLRPQCCEKAIVVTCWTNRNDDNHATLDRSKYALK